MTVYRIWLNMASDEWAGHEGGRIMERLAREQLDLHPDKFTPESIVIVEVYEHGGWWLHYTLHPDNPTGPLLIVGTANDSGKLSPVVERIGQRFRGARTEWLDRVNRDELVCGG